MKKFRIFLIAALSLIAFGCQDMREALSDIETRLTLLEGTKIATIDEQITSIQNSIKILSDAKDALEIKEADLAKLIDDLEEYDDAADEAFDDIENALKGLQKKDEELGKLIEQLNAYVDESLSKEKDWVNATFCTLEQYQALADEVASLKQTLKNTSTALEDLEKLSAEVATLKEQFDSAGEEYDKKLSALDEAIKSWVGEALSGYYDIATMDAKLADLATKEQMQKDIEAIQKQIDDAKTELTEAYNKAIQDAIETNNGVIDKKIATEIDKVMTRIDDVVNEINDKIAGLEKRIKALEDMVAGLKVSDSVFGFITYTQKDTITKGLKFPFVFRVNPSGVAITKDMVVLDNMSSTKYLVEPDTKASYITESKNFYVDSLGKARNAANEEMDGQYFIRLANKDTRNMIDDNIFSLVGAYRDKNDVVQYVSSNPFQIVMMPTPEEGLYPWQYSHGTVTRFMPVYYPEVPAHDNVPAQEAKTVYKEEMGCITFSLDSRSYKQENGVTKQTYSTKKYIRSLSFEGEGEADSLVIFQPVKDSGFVRFIPDTSKVKWAALMDTTKNTSLKLKGKIIASDRFGGQSSFPVEMTWYSRHRDTISVVKKVSDFYASDGVTKQPISLDLQSDFERLGYYYKEAQSARRKVLESFSTSNAGGRINFRTDVEQGERQYVTAKISNIVGKDKLPGTYYFTIVNTVISMPCEIVPDKKEEQIMAVLTIKLTINSD